MDHIGTWEVDPSERRAQSKGQKVKLKPVHERKYAIHVELWNETDGDESDRQNGRTGWG